MAETSPFSLLGVKANRTFTDVFVLSFAASRTARTLYLCKITQLTKAFGGTIAQQRKQPHNGVQISFTAQTREHYAEKEGPVWG